ncbi:MAG: hypothetical protein ABIA59_05290 [Candidatus Latescibacterota bacterium]
MLKTRGASALTVPMWIDSIKTTREFKMSRFGYFVAEANGPYNTNANSTSVVLELFFDNIRFLLTGDCYAKHWKEIIPKTTKSKIKMIQAPRHGAKNGMFSGKNSPWLDFVGKSTKIALSSHIHPHKHPHKDVIAKLENDSRTHFRTDQHYHLTFEIENGKLGTKWSHF